MVPRFLSFSDVLMTHVVAPNLFLHCTSVNHRDDDAEPKPPEPRLLLHTLTCDATANAPRHWCRATLV